jgi:hypothetical protein
MRTTPIATGQRWMRQLVDVLVDVHDIDSEAAAGVRPFAVYAQSSYALPKWATKPAVCERAIEIFHGPVLDDDRAFIHGDFYPGNVLWLRRTVSGLVDWEAATVGPRSMDVAHCRINLLYEGLDAADIFTRIWEQRTGRTFHRGPTSPPSSASSTPNAASRRPNANGTTSRRCSSALSTRSTARRRAQNVHRRPHRTRASPARTAHRAGDLYLRRPIPEAPVDDTHGVQPAAAEPVRGTAPLSGADAHGTSCVAARPTSTIARCSASPTNGARATGRSRSGSGAPSAR